MVMNKNAEIWKITVVFKTGDAISMCTSEHACKTAYDSWIDSISAFDAEGTAADLIEIDGITDTADRAPTKMGFLRSEVKAISILRMY